MPAVDPSVVLYESAVPFLSVYPDYDVNLLPSWIRESITEARVYGSKQRCVILPDGRKYHLDNALNSMCGRDWTLFINSVFCTRYPTNGKEGYAHKIRKIHPTPKPPQLMRDLISFFTKEGELVFDAFSGVGGTLLGAALCGRRAFGIDLNQTYLDAYAAAAEQLELPVFPTIQGDCRSLLRSPEALSPLLSTGPISLMLIDPPYANMMSKEKTGGDIAVYGNVATPFSDDPADLGNMDRDTFLEALRDIVSLTLPHIKKRGYVIVFIKDLQPQKKSLNMLHYEVAAALNEIPNLHYKGMKIWADESTKPYPYGYPFSFVANQIHQYILVFRKEK